MKDPRPYGEMFKNKTTLSVSPICGCFYCLKTFTVRDVSEWTDEGTTPICPKCSVDAVVPFIPDHDITIGLFTLNLKKWHKTQFKIPEN